MGWLFSITLFFIGIKCRDINVGGLIFIASGLFAIAGSTGLKSFK